MLKTYLLPIFLLASFALQAQQEAQYTQFMYNKLLLNPAYAGSRGVPTVSALYRNQWYSIEGSPQSALATFHSPFLNDRIGLGASASHSSIGLHRDFQFTLSYSYHIINKEDFSLRVGLSGSLRAIGLELNKAEPLSLIDPSLDNKRINDTYGNFGAGLYATYHNMVYLGFSVPHIVTNSIGINTSPDVTTAKEIPHFYATAGAVLPLSDNLKLLPAVMVKYVKNAPVSADINANLEVNNKITGGVSYRSGGDGKGESIGLLAYYQINQMVGVGAAFDITLGKLSHYNGGSFELLLQADLKKPYHSMSNPRFFF